MFRHGHCSLSKSSLRTQRRNSRKTWALSALWIASSLALLAMTSNPSPVRGRGVGVRRLLHLAETLGLLEVVLGDRDCGVIR